MFKSWNNRGVCVIHERFCIFRWSTYPSRRCQPAWNTAIQLRRWYANRAWRGLRPQRIQNSWSHAYSAIDPCPGYASRCQGHDQPARPYDPGDWSRAFLRHGGQRAAKYPDRHWFQSQYAGLSCPFSGTDPAHGLAGHQSTSSYDGGSPWRAGDCSDRIGGQAYRHADRCRENPGWNHGRAEGRYRLWGYGEGSKWLDGALRRRFNRCTKSNCQNIGYHRY